MAFEKHRFRQHFLGKFKRVWESKQQRIDAGAFVTDHHSEIHDLLSLLREIGEAANLAPLKGIVGIIQLLFDKAQALRVLSTVIKELMQDIISHLRGLSSIVGSDPVYARRFVQDPHRYRRLLSCLDEHEMQLRQLFGEVHLVSTQPRQLWRYTRSSASVTTFRQRFIQIVTNFQCQCVAFAALNSCHVTTYPISATPPLMASSAVTSCDIEGVPRLESYAEFTLRGCINGSGFFYKMSLGEVLVRNIGTVIIKRIKQSQKRQYCQLMRRTLEQRHPNLPQLLATFTYPHSGDLLLMFHSPGHEYQPMSYALGIGCNFWPGLGRSYYVKMGGCWKDTERKFTITPKMIQTAQVDNHGRLMLSFPEPSPEPPHRALDSAEAVTQCESNAVMDTQDADSEDEIDEEAAREIVLRLTEVKCRIEYLSGQDERPPDDEFRHMTSSKLVVHADTVVLEVSQSSNSSAINPLTPLILRTPSQIDVDLRPLGLQSVRPVSFSYGTPHARRVSISFPSSGPGLVPVLAPNSTLPSEPHVKPPRQPPVCYKCGEMGFMNTFSYNRHVQNCAGQTPARCRVCLQLYPSKVALGGHLELGHCTGLPVGMD